MEEVDKIIILSLRGAGCNIDDEHQTLATFTAELLYEAVRSCVKAIKMAEVDVPAKFPQGMSQRYKAGTSLALLVKEIGYTGEIGYQTFLYSNEAEIRKLLMYLVEKLPRDRSGSGTEDSARPGAVHGLKDLITSKIRDQLKQAWLPHYCLPHIHITQPFRGHVLLPITRDLSKNPSKEMMNYYNEYLPLVRDQAPNHIALCAAIVENNAVQLIHDQNTQLRLHAPKQKVKSDRLEQIRQTLLAEARGQTLVDNYMSVSVPESRFTQLEKLQHTHQVNQESVGNKTATSLTKAEGATEEEIQEQEEKEVESLKNELQSIVNRITQIQAKVEKAASVTDQTKAEIENKKKLNEDKTKEYQVKKKTLDVLPEAEQTIGKVKQLISGAEDRMKSLESQWLQHKQEVVGEIDTLKAQTAARQQLVEQKIEEIKQFKQDMRVASEEAKAKDDLLNSLTKEFEAMKKDVSRSSYTKRILEIVASIKKQKHDIDKVLQDTRTVQKDINLLTGKLDRSFTVTDELLFKDAKKDESVRAAYKYLASLHENFNAARNTVEETGVILREIRQLEDQLDQENRKESASNLEKITDDYTKIKKENLQLMSKLQVS